MTFFLVWCSISLTVLLLIINMCKYVDGNDPSEMTDDDWAIAIISSVLYPVGIMLLVGYTTSKKRLFSKAFQGLLKTRTFWWSNNEERKERV